MAVFFLQFDGDPPTHYNLVVLIAQFFAFPINRIRYVVQRGYD